MKFRTSDFDFDRIVNAVASMSLHVCFYVVYPFRVAGRGCLLDIFLVLPKFLI